MKLTLKASRGLEVLVDMQEQVTVVHNSAGFGMGFNSAWDYPLREVTFIAAEISFEDDELELLRHLQEQEAREDEIDSEIAHKALAELEANPDSLIRGEVLEERLRRLHEKDVQAIGPRRRPFPYDDDPAKASKLPKEGA